MRSPIDFLDPGVEPNADGSTPDPVTVLSGVQAKIWGPTGRELFHAQQVSAEVTHKIIMRFPQDVKIRSRFIIHFDGREFRILYAVDPDEMKQELHILAAETNDG
jgi:SPP1 family predicted phage head-tail adaptor